MRTYPSIPKWSPGTIRVDFSFSSFQASSEEFTSRWYRRYQIAPATGGTVENRPARGAARARRVRQVGRREGRVVVVAPEGRDHLRRGDDPADPEPGEAVRLAQPVRHDRPFGGPPERPRPGALPLRAKGHFVPEEPGAGV